MTTTVCDENYLKVVVRVVEGSVDGTAWSSGNPPAYRDEVIKVEELVERE